MSTYGKTFLALRLIERCERFLFIDPKGKEAVGVVCDGMEALYKEVQRCRADGEELRVTYYPESDGKEGVEEFETLCRLVEEMGNEEYPFAFFVDEIHHWVNPHSFPDAFSRIFRMAPGLGIRICGIGQRYGDFNSLFFTQADTIITVRQTHPDDLKKIDGFASDLHKQELFDLVRSLRVGEYVVLRDYTLSITPAGGISPKLDNEVDVSLHSG